MCCPLCRSQACATWTNGASSPSLRAACFTPQVCVGFVRDCECVCAVVCACVVLECQLCVVWQQVRVPHCSGDGGAAALGMTHQVRMQEWTHLLPAFVSAWRWTIVHPLWVRPLASLQWLPHGILSVMRPTKDRTCCQARTNWCTQLCRSSVRLVRAQHDAHPHHPLHPPARQRPGILGAGGQGQYGCLLRCKGGCIAAKGQGQFRYWSHFKGHIEAGRRGRFGC